MQLLALIGAQKRTIILDLINLLLFILACQFSVNVRLYPWYSTFLTLSVIAYFYFTLFNLLTEDTARIYLKELYQKYYSARHWGIKILILLAGTVYSSLQCLFFLAAIYFFDFWYQAQIPWWQETFLFIYFFFFLPVSLMMLSESLLETAPKNPFLKTLYFTIPCIGLPAFTLWKIMVLRAQEKMLTDKNTDKTYPEIKKVFLNGAQILFPILVTNIFYIEYYANLNYQGNAGWLMDNFFLRAIIFFLTIYLPFKFLLYLTALKKSSWKFDLLWNGFIFLLQLTLFYIFL